MPERGTALDNRINPENPEAKKLHQLQLPLHSTLELDPDEVNIPAISKPKLDWLSGGGEIAELIRAKDWSTTPLGPIELWPQSLRTTVSLCLASNFPINIIWGPEAIQIYNDGYRVLCGGVHPRAIGESYRVTWESAWPALGKPFERASLGQASFIENQRMFLYRNGYLEETFFTFSLSPIRDEVGAVVGLFHPVTETTTAMLNQRRTRLLRDLASESSNTDSISEVVLRIMRTLADYKSDIPGALILIEDKTGVLVIAGSSGDTIGFTDLSKWPLQQAMETKQPFVVEHMEARFGRNPCSEYNEPIQRACLLPIFRSDRMRPAGFLVVTLSTRLPYNEAYMGFCDLLSNAVNEAIAKAEVNEIAQVEREGFQETIKLGSQLHEFFMQAPIPMAVLEGPEHRYTVSNPPYEKMIGRKTQGLTIAQVFPGGEVKTFIPLLDSVYQTGTSQIGRGLPLVLPDESGLPNERWIDVGYHPFRDKNGEIRGVLAIHYDVTESVLARKKTEENEAKLAGERAKLEAIFYGTGTAMALFRGPELVFEMVNQKYLDMVSNRDVLGKTLLEGMPELAHSVFPDLIQGVYKTGEPCQISEGLTPILNTFSGKLEDRYFDSTYVRLSDGIQNSFLIICHATDVTERVRTRTELVLAKDFAEASTKSKSAFLANMSHEIRTPLSAILGFTDILKETDLTNEEQTKYLNIIGRNGQALVRIIDDILDLSKVEADKMHIEQGSFFLSELIRDVLSMFIDRARGKGISLNFQSEKLPQFKIDSDAVRIRQILVNVVGNAIKFTSEGSVTIHGHYRDIDSGRFEVVLCVTDTGIGITPEQATILFRAFSQADNSTTRHYGGTGLGLALSKKLAHAMGGDISIEKNSNTIGSTFLIKLIVKKSSDQDSHNISTQVTTLGKAQQRLRGWHILVVDDAEDNRLLLRVLLEREGAIVDQANSGNDGILKAKASGYDLILMDIQMPGMDGYQTLAKLRDEGFKKPIFALTAHTMKEERNRALAAGFTGHISKPVNPTILLETLVAHSRQL